ncbi:MAG: hypothetical protein NDI61_13055 [Bdellovibrionaceae bacterium]|nr:hypothetical protein [Pseudobdellovibrionaceae bacterium]
MYRSLLSIALWGAMFSMVSEASTLAQTACSNQVGSCAYYGCLSDELACRPQAYLRRFGRSYCSLFEARADEYTEQGQKFMTEVRLCLQLELDAEIGLTCQNVERRSANHHVTCYLESGYCELPRKDQFLLQRTIFKDLASRPALWGAALRISRACLMHATSRSASEASVSPSAGPTTP